MGIYSDNFYSFCNRMSDREKAAMDAADEWDETKHAREGKGSGKGGQFKAKPETIEKQDLLDPRRAVKAIATRKEMEKIKEGGNPNEDKFESVTPEDLLTTKIGSTNSKYREMRNRLAEYVRKNIGDGTYPLVDVQDEEAVKELKPSSYDDGYMVSFQTTNGEGYNKKFTDRMLTDEAYDAKVEEIQSKYGGIPHVGVFGGIPEISFKVDTKKKAKKIAEDNNQVSYWDNKAGAKAIAGDSDPTLTDEEKGRLWLKANRRNIKYEWEFNQVVKVKK